MAHGYASDRSCGRSGAASSRRRSVSSTRRVSPSRCCCHFWASAASRSSSACEAGAHLRQPDRHGLLIQPQRIPQFVQRRGRRLVIVEEIDAARRQPHPLDDRLALGLGADDFEQTVADGQSRGVAGGAGAAGEQSLQLAALVQPLFVAVGQRLVQRLHQDLRGSLHRGPHLSPRPDRPPLRRTHYKVKRSRYRATALGGASRVRRRGGAGPPSTAGLHAKAR